MAEIFSVLTTFFNSIPWWVADILLGVIGGFVFMFIMGIFSPVRRLYNQILFWIDGIKKRNMNVNVEMNSGIGVSTPLPSVELTSLIEKALSTDYNIETKGQGQLKIKHKLNKCNIETKILCVPSSMDEEEEICESLQISIISKDLKLKDLKKGFFEIKNFLIDELFIKINRSIKIDIGVLGFSVFFQTIPQLIQVIKGFKPISTALKSEDGDLEIVFQKDKFTFSGDFKTPNIEKMSKFTKEILIS